MPTCKRQAIVNRSYWVQALETKQLQKEAAQRLNVMIDELRNSQNADLSAKNLGDEGTGYIAEGLAFNDRCAGGRRASLAHSRDEAAGMSMCSKEVHWFLCFFFPGHALLGSPKGGRVGRFQP